MISAEYGRLCGELYCVGPSTLHVQPIAQSLCGTQPSSNWESLACACLLWMGVATAYVAHADFHCGLCWCLVMRCLHWPSGACSRGEPPQECPLESARFEAPSSKGPTDRILSKLLERAAEASLPQEFHEECWKGGPDAILSHG